jgi:hypothetical protein
MRFRLVLPPALGGAALVLGLAAAALIGSGGPRTAAQTAEAMFPALAARGADLTGLTIEARRYRLELERRDGQWVAVDRGDYLVRQQPVLAILDSLAEFSPLTMRTDDPARYSAFDATGPGPDREDARITVWAGGDIVADAIIGTPGAVRDPVPRSGVHVRRVDEAEVWLAAGVITIPMFLSNYLEPLAQIRGTEVARISMLEGDRLLMTAEKVDFDTATYHLVYLDPEIGAVEEAMLDNNAVRALNQAIVTISADDVLARDALAFPDNARTLRFETRTGLRLEMTAAAIGEEMWFVFEVGTTPDAVPVVPAPRTAFEIFFGPPRPEERSEAERLSEAIRARTEHWAFKLPEFNTLTLTRELGEIIEVFRVPSDLEAPY